MINYTPSNQLTLEGFKHPFYKQLKPDNRWVKLAEVIPWDELAGIYSRNLDPDAGRLSIDIRLVIGALVIKHKMKLSDRIVNIYQPHVRPMVRGKDGADVEFGAKINVSEVEGFVRCNHIGWDNYDEGSDLKKQVEDFQKIYGCYPELLLGDRRYLNRENRQYLKNMGIRIVGKPLGRPPKQELSGYQKYKTRKEQNMRNHVEGKFGQGKNGYNLNQIRARRQDTSESWISAILFVMNLTKLMKVAIDYGNFLTLFVLRHLRKIFLPVVINNGIPANNKRIVLA